MKNTRWEISLEMLQKCFHHQLHSACYIFQSSKRSGKIKEKSLSNISYATKAAFSQICKIYFLNIMIIFFQLVEQKCPKNVSRKLHQVQNNLNFLVSEALCWVLYFVLICKNVTNANVQYFDEKEKISMFWWWKRKFRFNKFADFIFLIMKK